MKKTDKEIFENNLETKNDLFEEDFDDNDGGDLPECNPRAGLDWPAEGGGRWQCLWGTSSLGCTVTSRASEHCNADADADIIADADADADADIIADADGDDDPYHGSIIVNISPLRRDGHPFLILCSHRAVILKDFVCRTEK